MFPAQQSQAFQRRVCASPAVALQWSDEEAGDHSDGEDNYDDNEDQLRSVSDYIAEELRNSEQDVEELFSRLAGVNSDIIHDTNTNFATSEKYETSDQPSPGHPAAPQRSCETKPHISPTEPIAPVKSEKDIQNSAHSVSETRSEVDRRDPEVSKSEAKPIGSDIADGSEDLSQLPQLIHDYLIVLKEQERGKKLQQNLLSVRVALSSRFIDSSYVS